MLRSTILWWLALAGFALLSPALLPPAPLAAAPAGNTLTQVALGDEPDYTRLAFTFQKPLTSYTVRRDDVDRVVVDFGPVAMNRIPDIPQNALIQNVELKVADDRLTAVIQLAAMRYELRHFASRDKYSCVLDFKNIEDQVQPDLDSADLKPLEVPSLAEVAARLELLAPPKPEDGEAEHLLRRIGGELRARNNPAALSDLKLFKRHFPRHPANEYADFLLAELDYLSAPRAETYARATEEWKTALENWPQSLLAPRARFMLAEADREAGLINEAAAKFKLVADDALTKDDIYGQLALLRASDLLMSMGLLDEGRGILEPVLQEGHGNRLGLEAYARAGMADFYQGFFSQANEIFRQALSQAPNLYQTFPEMLYATGEGYHYLNRPDLSRMFLMHALNLMPTHPKADVIMARIGDSYRKEGRDREAMAIYGAARRNFPNGDGGLISQVRLADMGALHSFFAQDKVFDALERGSRQATVEMYKKIVENGSASPLMQLPQLKIGTALAEDGENSEAITWLRDLEINNPKSSLLPEALPILNQALVNEALLRQELEDWQGLTDLYADNSSYLFDADRPAVQRMAAQAYEKQGRFADARDLWEEMAEDTPEKRLARYQALVLNSLKIGQPMDALNYLIQMTPEFPQERNWIDRQVTQVGRDLAVPRNAQATENLLQMVESVDTEPARRDALTSAIEREINDRRYQQAMPLMDRYRREYPDDELTPEYLLTQAKIEDHEKRYEQAWDLGSDFRLLYPDDPRVPTLLLDQIERAENLGRVDDVLRFMDLYRSRFPDNPESRAMLVARVDREWNLGRYQDARDSLNTYRRSYPGDPALIDLIIKYSNQNWDQGRFDDARWALDELILNHPDDPRTLAFLLDRADREWQKERYDQAQALMDQLLRLYPREPGVGDLMLKRADGDWDRGRREAAQKDWEDFRRAFPDDSRVGRSYLDQYRKNVAGGFMDQATALAEEFRAVRPQDAAAQADLLLEEAKDFLAAGRLAEGLDCWNRFRQTYPDDPRNPDLLLIQARQELKAGREAEALEHYQQFIDRYPDNAKIADVYLEAAAAEAQAGRRDAAWNHLDRFRSLFPDHPGRPQAFLDQAEQGRLLGRPAEAANLYEAFRQAYPESPQLPGTYLPEARLHIAAGAPLAAIDTLRAGITAAPALDDDPEVQALLTDLLLENGLVEDWAALVERNLDRAENPGANLADRFLKYNQLAQVNQELGRAAEAERNYDSALANRPPGVSPETLYAVATAYKKLLRPEKYASTLTLVRDGGDPFWQKIAETELATLASPGGAPPAAGAPSAGTP